MLPTHPDLSIARGGRAVHPSRMGGLRREGGAQREQRNGGERQARRGGIDAAGRAEPQPAGRPPERAHQHSPAFGICGARTVRRQRRAARQPHIAPSLALI